MTNYQIQHASDATLRERMAYLGNFIGSEGADDYALDHEMDEISHELTLRRIDRSDASSGFNLDEAEEE